MPFFAVRWGLTTRISTKVNTDIEACIEVFGQVSPTMKVKDLGNVAKKLQNDKWRNDQLSDNKGWRFTAAGRGAGSNKPRPAFVTEDRQFDLVKWREIMAPHDGPLTHDETQFLFKALQAYTEFCNTNG